VTPPQFDEFFFALSVRLFRHPRPKFEEFSQNRKENVTKSNICFFCQNNLIAGKLRENWSSRNSFFIAASSDSFKNIVKTHGGILVKTEKKRKCHKVKY
jgi:hypothetical protein